MNVTYCPSTGKPYTLEYDDKVSVGIHRKGTQLTIPLGTDAWSTMVKQDSLQLIMTSDDQIDIMIERLNKLKKLNAKYQEPVEELVI